MLTKKQGWAVWKKKGRAIADPAFIDELVLLIVDHLAIAAHTLIATLSIWVINPKSFQSLVS